MMMEEQLKPLPLDWVEVIYRKFSVYWGDAFLAKWKGIPHDDLMLAWAEELAGFTPDELKTGLQECKKKTFPVSLPEFMNLCRPAISSEDAFAEAMAQSQLRPIGKDRWTHPAIFWTYYALSWEFKNLTTKELEKRWANEFKRIMGIGMWKEIPTITTELISYKPEEKPSTAVGKRSFDDLVKNWGLR
jgi:hypothetical protein